MKRRKRIYYTDTQKALMWDRWQQGESLHQIASLFDRHPSSVRNRRMLAEKHDVSGMSRRHRGDVELLRDAQIKMFARYSRGVVRSTRGMYCPSAP